MDRCDRLAGEDFPGASVDGCVSQEAFVPPRDSVNLFGAVVTQKYFRHCAKINAREKKVSCLSRAAICRSSLCLIYRPHTAVCIDVATAWVAGVVEADTTGYLASACCCSGTARPGRR